MGEVMASAVAAVDGVYVVVKDDGNVFWVDANSGHAVDAGKLKGKAPFSVACSVGANVENCVIADSEGNMWHGTARPMGQPFKPVAIGRH